MYAIFSATPIALIRMVGKSFKMMPNWTTNDVLPQEKSKLSKIDYLNWSDECFYTYMTRPPKNGSTEKPFVDLFLRISLQMTAPLRKWPNVTIDAALAILSRCGSKSKAICSILMGIWITVAIRSGDGSKLKCENDVVIEYHTTADNNCITRLSTVTLRRRKMSDKTK